MRRLLAWLGFHQHEWGIIHREGECSACKYSILATALWHTCHLVQTCYSCGKDRVVKVRFE